MTASYESEARPGPYTRPSFKSLFSIPQALEKVNRFEEVS